MPASIQTHIDTDLLAKEAALIAKMSGYEKEAQDLYAKDSFSDEDSKKWEELNAQIHNTKTHVEAVQAAIGKQADNRDKALVAGESDKGSGKGRPSIQKHMVNFIKHGSRNKLDEGDQEFLHDHKDVQNLYENIQDNGGGVSMLRIPIGKEAFDSALARICLLYTSPSPRDRQKSRMPSSA